MTVSRRVFLLSLAGAGPLLVAGAWPAPGGAQAPPPENSSRGELFDLLDEGGAALLREDGSSLALVRDDR